jgi:hypothetical protein
MNIFRIFGIFFTPFRRAALLLHWMFVDCLLSHHVDLQFFASFSTTPLLIFLVFFLSRGADPWHLPWIFTSTYIIYLICYFKSASCRFKTPLWDGHLFGSFGCCSTTTIWIYLVVSLACSTSLLYLPWIFWWAYIIYLICCFTSALCQF